MATTLDTLTVPITGSVAGLQTAFAQAGKLTQNFAAGVGTKLNAARNGVNALGGAFLKLAAPVAAAASAFMSVKTVLDSINRADGLAKTSSELGVTVQALQKLHVAASMNASNAEDMNNALRMMTRVLGEAYEEGSEAEKALKELGFTLSDFAGLSSDQAMMKFADALNSIEESGKRADLANQIFGRGAKNIAGVIAAGSAGIREMGDEAEKTGKVLSKMEFGKLLAANDALDKLGAALQALGDRLAVAFGPVIDWLGTAINDWIGDVRGADETFNGFARGVVKAIGVIRLAWDGLQLMWAAGKVAVGALAVGVNEFANAAVKAFKWVSDLAGKTWDFISASFKVNADAIAVGWEWVKSKAVIAFATIGEAFAKTIIAMGQTARESGIKGLSDIGWQAEVAGADLLVGAMKLRQGAEAGVKAAKDDLDQSVQNLEAAKEAFSKPADLTTGLEGAVERSHQFFQEVKSEFKDLAQSMADQEGGNAYDNTLISFDRSLEKSTAKAIELGEQYAQSRETVAKRLESAEELANQRSLDRRAAYYEELAKRTQEAEETLTLLQESEQERRQALLAESAVAYEEQNFKERMQWAEMWQSGMEGKLQIMSGLLSGFASLMQSKNKSMFQVGKAAAMAETVVNTFLSAQLAYTRALEIPGIGLALAPIAAASAIAGGLMRLQQISSTQFGSSTAPGAGGGGATPGMSGAASAKESAAASSQSNVNVTLYGSTFSGEQVRGLIAAINDQTGDNMSLKAQVG